MIPKLITPFISRGDPVFELLGFFANSAMQEQPNELKNLSRGDLLIALPTVPKFFNSVNHVTVGGPTKSSNLGKMSFGARDLGRTSLKQPWSAPESSILPD